MKQRTLLLLGAGSSRDFGFPLASELTAEIANALRFDTSEFRLSGGNENIRMLLENVRFNQQHLFNQYLQAADHISRTVHLSSSIDRFLESNRDKPSVPELAKLAISQIIADYERRSPLAVETFRLPFFDTSILAGTWLAKLFGYIHTNESEDQLEAIFDKIRIVTFNYDRTFEQFIIIAVINFYKVTPQRALELLSKIHVTHVYGSLGTLSQGAESQQFGTCKNEVAAASRRIQTFHESVGSETITEISAAVQWAERVFVLGFSFAPMNMNLFEECKPSHGVRPVFATNFKVSEFNSQIARHQFDRIFCQNNSVTQFFPVECPQFFDDIQLAI